MHSVGDEGIVITQPNVVPPVRRLKWLRLRWHLLCFLGVGVIMPFYVAKFWLQLGSFVFAAMVGALGLALLVGCAGQVSLAIPFFIAIGGYGYTYFASETQTTGIGNQFGLSLPPLLAALAAVTLAGAAGLAFTPIAARLQGIYLAVVSFGLVFLGQHILFNVKDVTGGFNGRSVPPFKLFGFTFADTPGETLHVFGVPFGREQKVWYLGLTVVVAAYAFFVALLNSRAGRSLLAVRDGETAAAAMGVNVTQTKAKVFVLSAMYAGVAGVLLALAFQRLVPDSYNITMAVDYLAMIVIGGVASPGGALMGATFVASLPTLLSRYSDLFPFLAKPGSGGITPGIASRLVFGAAIVVVLMFEPGGLNEAFTKIRRMVTRPDRR